MLPSYGGGRQSLAQLYGVVIILVDGARLSGLIVGQLTRLSNAEGCPLEFLIRGVLFFALYRHIPVPAGNFMPLCGYDGLVKP
jgi:hypothetical protein